VSWTRFLTFTLGVGLALDATYWILRLPQHSGDPITALQFTEAPRQDVQGLATWLGQREAAAGVTASNADFRLLGVVAGESMRGSAVIAVSGKAPRTYRVGDPVADGLLLQSVAPRQATLAATAASGAPLVLELAKPQLSTARPPESAASLPGMPPQTGVRRSPRRPPGLD
jgi:general secretion pathway protein C